MSTWRLNKNEVVLPSQKEELFFTRKLCVNCFTLHIIVLYIAYINDIKRYKGSQVHSQANKHMKMHMV